MNNDFFKSLERSISSSRISTYKSNGHTEIETIADYVLNAKISENFYFLLQKSYPQLIHKLSTSGG